MTDFKDIAVMFAKLETYLVRSLKRNLKGHKDWEKAEGFDWTAWQAEKLREIKKYQKENRDIAKYFLEKIQPDTESMLREQYEEGSGDPSFFNVNKRRLDALIKESGQIEENVTKAALRNMDDVYRKTVQKAALGLNSGVLTVNKAIDLATEDFLAQGINCIQYKDGRRVNIASYAEMALRTNATRAALYGLGSKMKELGVDTVLISEYGACSPTCRPWQGKVYINDVFMDFDGVKGVAWGKSRDGNTYLLLSHAVKNGLFHPDCRHHMGIYTAGVTKIPPPISEEVTNRNYELEQKQRAYERRVRKYKRLESGTLDSETAKKYKAARISAQSDLKKFVDANGDVLRRDYRREALKVPVIVPENESQHKWKSRDTLIDRKYIESNEYRRKFDKLQESKEITRLIYQNSKKMLYHRSGTNYEDLCFINSETGETLCQNRYEIMEGAVSPTAKMLKMLSGNENKIITIHNHPVSSVPSSNDLFLCGSKKYKYGIIVCHNGDVYMYKNNTELTLLYFNIKFGMRYESDIYDFDRLIDAANSMRKDGHDIWIEKL
jgi:hypothetical protein